MRWPKGFEGRSHKALFDEFIAALPNVGVDYKESMWVHVMAKTHVWILQTYLARLNACWLKDHDHRH